MQYVVTFKHSEILEIPPHHQKKKKERNCNETPFASKLCSLLLNTFCSIVFGR